jgi:putative sigma-54 modulation protein
MRLEIQAPRDTIPEPVKSYTEKRFGKLARRLHAETLIEVTLSKERNPAIRDGHSAEAVVHTKGPNIVGRESAPTFEAAIDMLVQKLERQIERQRDKRVLEPRRAVQRGAVAPGPPAAPPEPEETGE